MLDKLRFYVHRLSERLWVRPLAFVLLSVAAAFIARAADQSFLGKNFPEINPASIETLLSIMASSMLVIATFAVSSMVSAYSAASSSATPRSFALVVSDDVSQNALSTFIGAFIFSIVALVAFKNEYYGKAGNFALFVLTLTVFALVISTLIHWVDRIARLGRLETTVKKVEQATADSLARRRQEPRLGGAPLRAESGSGAAIHGSKIGYVQRIDMESLQEAAERAGVHLVIAGLPGAFVGPGRPLVTVSGTQTPEEDLIQTVDEAFRVGTTRVFSDDPRFGLVVLSQIAQRALSPAVNDPGTAIDVLGSFVRLFAQWVAPPPEPPTARYPRILVPEISALDLMDDAFTAVARDGASMLEVSVRMQKTFHALGEMGHGPLRRAAEEYAARALARSKETMTFTPDWALLKSEAQALHGTQEGTP